MATYVIATNGDNATGTGSEANPWADVGKFTSVAQPGDTLLCRGGTYSASVNVSPTGNANNWIAIKNYPDELPEWTFNSAATTDSIFRLGGGAEYVILDGLVVRDNNLGRGISVADAAFITIRNCVVHDVNQRGIGGSGDDITIEDNTLYNCAEVNLNYGLSDLGGGWPGIIATTTGSGGAICNRWLVRRNYVYNSWGEGLLIQVGDGCSVLDNRVRNTFSKSVYLNKLSNSIILRNTIWVDDATYNRDGRAADGISWAAEGTGTPSSSPVNLTIANNIITGVRHGIDYFFHSGNTNNNNTYSGFVVAFNVCYQLGGCAVDLDDVAAARPQPTGNLMHNNLFHGTMTVSPTDDDGWTFTHNVWTTGVPGGGAHTNTIAGTPVYVSANNSGDPYGFMLAPNSIGIRQGTKLAAVLDDFLTRLRDETPTIGAFEYLQAVGGRQTWRGFTPARGEHRRR